MAKTMLPSHVLGLEAADLAERVGDPVAGRDFFLCTALVTFGQSNVLKGFFADPRNYCDSAGPVDHCHEH